MFPVLIYLPFIIALYACLNLIIQILSGNEIVIDTHTIAGLISSFFMMLLMRTFDDLKDFEIDKELFPERATQRKAVLKSDIVIISISSFIILVLVNVLLSPKTLLVFAFIMTYALLTYKWFFAEKFHRTHIFVTMLDHQPLPYVINFFLIHTALASGVVYENFTLTHFFLLLIVSFPVTAWEVSRKIRSKDMETQYETFSMVLGIKTATIIPLILITLTGILSLYIGNLLNFSIVFFIINIILIVYAAFYYIRFLIKPLNKYNVLKNTSMISTSLMFINLLINTLLVYII
jgi:4-hydroxybenzoate polyprenyltransferase